MLKEEVAGESIGLMERDFRFYEFFAGGGMARAGLGDAWECVFANDYDDLKETAYTTNWGKDHFLNKDIGLVSLADLPPTVDMAWASFPCQDLSVAGNGAGIGGADQEKATRSGAVWPFLDLIDTLTQDDREPKTIVLENVLGLLTLNGGREFSTICQHLSNLNYRFGAVVVDARHFVAQSRPRVFIVAVSRDGKVPDALKRETADPIWHPPTVVRAYDLLHHELKRDWIWWNLGEAPVLAVDALEDAIDLENPNWNSVEETDRLVAMMSPNHIARLEAAKAAEGTSIGSLYLRMRREGKVNVQRAEISFGPTLGCLRTPRGGASRPRIIVVKDGVVNTRLVTTQEAAKLMGLHPSYTLPAAYSLAFKILGDGVVTQVVRFLADRLLEPLITGLHARAPRAEAPDVISSREKCAVNG